MAADMSGQVDVPHLLGTLFKDVADPIQTEQERDLRLYPETILQKSENGNKLYASFQRYSPQFIKAVDDSEKKQVLRWRSSNTESAQRIILDSWIAQNSDVGSTTTKNTSKLPTSISSKGRANKLFVWSSSDSYIEEKKRQLQLRKSIEGISSQPDKPDKSLTDKEEKPVEHDTKLEALQQQLHLKLSTDRINNKLSRKIESEANRFIHARIQKIRNHHSEQMMNQINERKKKDHEVYLQRLKIKEEEYEKSIRQDQEQVAGAKKLNFFGSLFGLSGGTMSPSAEPGSPIEVEGQVTKNGTKTFSKGKRSTLFGMQSLFSSGNGSKKHVDKTVMFDAEDKSDTQSIAGSNISTNANLEGGELASATTSDSATHSDTKTSEIRVPLFNVDDLESLEMKRSPQKSNRLDVVGHNGSPSKGRNEAEDSDDDFTEFTAVTEATSENNSVSSPPILAPVPKLSRNFFSVEKANANATPALSGNELIDLFDTNASRPDSSGIETPAPLSQSQDKMDVNLLEL
ncbi:hypothetical protein KGF57_003071 [Candida theae]|uniref:Uncharacterized protein n=1 Tax=Candida theae TaxID=1198502 RepID=A0AAD5FYA6_9ASCO|nr:uncharacterized protein KGF57_003071 [Candida theae]KAI5957804.1 hypothetical protein KGF57_003071 [Candida theae]